MNIVVDRVKCACSDCVCVVDVEKSVKREERIFCSDTCADHHDSGSGCEHAGCTCHG